MEQLAFPLTNNTTRIKKGRKVIYRTKGPGLFARAIDVSAKDTAEGRLAAAVLKQAMLVVTSCIGRPLNKQSEKYHDYCSAMAFLTEPSFNLEWWCYCAGLEMEYVMDLVKLQIKG